MTPANAKVVGGRSFFPSLIEGPFRSGLHEAFLFAIVICIIAAAASWTRGARVPASGDTVHAAEVDLAGLAD
jgi:hypothetical protein